MTVTVIALVTINEHEPLALACYLKVTEPLMKRAKAIIISRFPLSEVVVGSQAAKTLIIVEYPSPEAVNLVFQSDEYKAVIPVRDRAFSSYNISMVGEI